MKKSFYLALLSSTVLLSACGEKPNPEITLAPISADVHYLASDELKGRASFTEYADNAAEYIAFRFKDVGLKPYKGSYLQSFSIYLRRPISTSVSLNGQAINLKDVAFVAGKAQLEWQDPSKLNITVVGADDSLRDAFRVANQQGGEQLLLVSPAQAKLFKRYKSYFEYPKAKMSKEDHGSLFAILTDDIKVNALNINATSELEEKPLSNVVGILPAKKSNTETVLFSAHYDHLPPKFADDKETIFNGADDNASGVSGIISLAKHFAALGNNKRDLMFVAFGAEEIGGFGSKYFSTHIDPNNIVAMINLEMIGKPSKFGAGKLWMTGYERSDLAQIMNQSLKSLNTEIYPDPYPKQNLFYRSDNATLARLGVPAHSFSSTQIDKDEHYHQSTDDVSTLDLKSLTQVVKTVAVASQPLVSGEATPSRIDKQQVKQSGKIF
ncbi:M28 family metallopeptidase [Parashewanella curva]|nr:M20/M25/M40 family metallo-hydrolase [Parashewanella curva]